MRRAALVIVLALLVACAESETPVAAPPTSGPTGTVTTPPASTSTSLPTTTSTSSTTSTTSTTVAARPLRVGDEGDDVLALERGLAALGYWTGAVDGTFDDSTTHAVVALQKAAGLARDGVAGDAVRGALTGAVLPTVAETPGLHAEIHLDQQLLVLVRDGVIETIFDTSTGVRAGSTPTGSWMVTREIDALHRSPLGLLYRPKYFVRGVAVHGYTSVPPRPASHGCVRVTYAAMDHIWASDLLPIGTPVIVG